MRANVKQVGSIATYIITGVLLAVILVGVAFFAVKRGQEVRSNQTADVPKTTGKETNKEPSTSSTNQPKKNEAENANSTTNSSAVGASTSPLPTTGPETAGQAVGLFMLTMMVVGYIASRRNMLGSL